MKENLEKTLKNLIITKNLIDKPLTYSEKILLSHRREHIQEIPKRGEDYCFFQPDRVAMQDATAQMALLQFMLTGRETTAAPCSVHCDHLIQARDGAEADAARAEIENKEVYEFLESVSLKYGIDFWGPNEGIIHQIVLENYAFPGGLMIGTDSHTPNAGGMGMIAVGVGGADAVDVLSGIDWELMFPKIIGVKLTGKLNPWVSPKDIILYLLGVLSVKGGTGAIIEYFGSGAETLSCTGKAAVCNMGAELGATASVFSPDFHTVDFLKKTGRKEIAEWVIENMNLLSPDQEVINSPEKYYNQLIEIDLSELEPFINGPYSPDKAVPLSRFKDTILENEYPEKLSAGLIGSCSNASYEDLAKVSEICRQFLENKIPLKTQFYISPGSKSVLETVREEGLLEPIEEYGGIILANACGPCIGQWDRQDLKKEEKNSIMTSFNRNFAKRNDGNPNTCIFIASPELITLYSALDSMLENPLQKIWKNSNGEPVAIKTPEVSSLPKNMFASGNYSLKGERNPEQVITVNDHSDRLKLLTPFPGQGNEDITDLRILIKTKGKCTTDHISMAGPWLKYRGHLPNISRNLLIGAVNAFNGRVNSVYNSLVGEYLSVPDSAGVYQELCIGTAVIADENYGEGSSREHAAMEPRFMGVKAVIARSFARIHETNLKKQGVLACVFQRPEDYDLIEETDLLSIFCKDLTPGKRIKGILKKQNGRVINLELNHTYNETQIKWFQAGSAINYIQKQGF